MQLSCLKFCWVCELDALSTFERLAPNEVIVQRSVIEMKICLVEILFRKILSIFIVDRIFLIKLSSSLEKLPFPTQSRYSLFTSCIRRS